MHRSLTVRVLAVLPLLLSAGCGGDEDNAQLEVTVARANVTVVRLTGGEVVRVDLGVDVRVGEHPLNANALDVSSVELLIDDAMVSQLEPDPLADTAGVITPGGGTVRLTVEGQSESFLNAADRDELCAGNANVDVRITYQAAVDDADPLAPFVRDPRQTVSTVTSVDCP